jgi:hypothetical protein
VINASLAKSGTKHPLLLARTRLELPHIQQVHHHEASRLWLVPWYPQAPTGETALLAMTIGEQEKCVQQEKLTNLYL